MEFSIGTFEGPLDLLLALVRKEEMDIMEIDIHQITQKYLNVIQEKSCMNLSEGGEFIQMASTLIYMKSRLLLPQTEVESLEEEAVPPQKTLAQILSQHSYYLKAAEKLNQRMSLDRDIWTCAGMDFACENSEEIQTEGPADLWTTFQKVLRRACTFPIKISWPSVSEWICKIQSFFVQGQTCSFKDLVQKQRDISSKHKDKGFAYPLLLSFLSLLELGKLGVVTMVQQKKDILIKTRKTIDDEVFCLLGGNLSFEKRTEIRRRA